MSGGERATLRQVAAMVTRMVGWEVNVRRVEKLRTLLVRDGYVEPLPKGDGGAQYGPRDVDLVAAEAWRRRTGWTLRGKAVDALFEAIVPPMGPGGEVRRMLLPKRVTWDRDRGEMEEVVPDRIELYVYPTGEECGALVWSGEMEDGCPVYTRE